MALRKRSFARRSPRSSFLTVSLYDTTRTTNKFYTLELKDCFYSNGKRNA